MLPNRVILLSLLWQCVSCADAKRYHSGFLLKVLNNARQQRDCLTYTVFLSERIRTNHLDDFHQLLQSNGIFPLVVYSGNVSEPRELRMFSDAFTLLSVVFAMGTKDPILRVVNDAHRGSKNARIVIVILQPIQGLNQVHDMCNWIWNKQFVNALVVVQTVQGENALYKYNPFPEFHIKAIDPDTRANLFQKGRRKLKGYVIQSPAHWDLPRVFKTFDPRTNSVHIRGLAAYIFFSFLQFKNGTFEEYLDEEDKSNKDQVRRLNINHTLQLIKNHDLEISMHPYSLFNRLQFGASFPIFYADWCLMVPIKNEIPAWMYLVQPFDKNLWITIFLGCIYITIVLRLCSHVLQRHTRRQQHCFASICFVLHIPLPQNIDNLHWKYIPIYIQLFVLGLILSNFYLAFLASFMTTTVYGAQLNTIEDVVREGLPVMSLSFESDTLFAGLPEALLRLVVNADPEKFFEHRDNFNTSYAYTVTNDRWEFFALQQRFVDKPLFRLSKICFGRHMVSFPMRYDSHLRPAMTQFIMAIQQSGMLQYWRQSDFNEAVRAGVMRRFASIASLKRIRLPTLTIAWAVLAVGWICAAAAFVLELTHKAVLNMLFK